jgi:alkanesulfonate monooxygenase SsuD/methylene tetrahydromethanopterin reductase-like flavin-dependent oxidoreductase (luciferase family)
VLMSGWTGLDFSKYGPDEPILHSRQDAQTSALEAFTIADPDRVWTVREIAKHAAVGGRGPVVVGSPEEVAEELIVWVEDTDVDGFEPGFGYRDRGLRLPTAPVAGGLVATDDESPDNALANPGIRGMG